MTTSAPPFDLEDFADFLWRQDTNRAMATASKLVLDGWPTSRILTDLIAPAQVLVGERWYRNEWGVADEHAATHTSDIVLSLLTGSPRSPSSTLTVAWLCPDGELHSLPARISARVAELHGFRVRYLGTSVPARDLDTDLRRRPVDAVAISASTPLVLDSALEAIEVAHAHDLPVIAGGRAFGSDSRRANTLGADLWIDDPHNITEQLGSRTGPLNPGNAARGNALEAGLQRGGLVDEAMSRLTERLPAARGFTTAQIQRTREDLSYTLQYAEAAILTQDPTLFTDYIGWLKPLLAWRNVTSDAVQLSLDILAEASHGLNPLHELLASHAAPASPDAPGAPVPDGGVPG